MLAIQVLVLSLSQLPSPEEGLVSPVPPFSYCQNIELLEFVHPFLTVASLEELIQFQSLHNIPDLKVCRIIEYLI